MTDPQTSAPEPGRRAASVAQQADQPSVPPQGRQEPTGHGGLEDPQTGRSHRRAEAGRAQARAGAAIANMAWPAALLAAIGMLAVGVILLVWPKATLTVVAILIGAALVVTGALRLFDAVTASGESGGMRAADIVIGLLAVIAGLYCLRHHSLTILAVTLVVGVLWIVHGVGDLTVAASMGKLPGRGLKVVTGLLSLAAGLVILFWPSISLILLLTVLAAWLLCYGVLLLFLAFSLRRDAHTLSRAADPAPA